MKAILNIVTLFIILIMVSNVAARTGRESIVDMKKKLSPKDSIAYIAALAKKSDMGIVIIYSADCQGVNSIPELPGLHVMALGGNQITMRNIQEMFSDNDNVHISEAAEHVIIIHIGDAPSDLLGTTLPVINFSQVEQYNPILAIRALLRAPNVKHSSHRLGLRLPTAFTGSLVVLPDHGLPHLPAMISDTTLGEMFNIIAVTFHGVVAYGVCPRVGLYNASFYDGTERPNLLLDSSH